MKTRVGFDAKDTLLNFDHPKWIAESYSSKRFPASHSQLQRLWHVATSRNIAGLDRHVVYFFILPALFFRFFPFIMTHNSTPLCAYLALVLVYIPATVALTAWKAYASLKRKMLRARENGKYSPVLSWSPPGQSSYSLPRWTTGGGRRNPDAFNLLLWLCGTLLTFWVYTWGISSPFPAASSLISSSPTLTANQARNATYYISTTFWNNEDMFDAWASETLQLIDILGRQNVYVSVTENDSMDDTATKLRQFGTELKGRNIMHNVNITSGIREKPLKDPWRSVPHRVGYMTNLRNGALQALEDVRKRFDVVVLLNDIVYHHTDVLKLVAALGGDDIKTDPSKDIAAQPKRRMACGLDLDGAALYDAWVLQDRCGRPITGLWPFFTSEEDKQAVRDGRVLEVGTCWNGIAVLDGDMFLEPSLRSDTADWDAEPLRFQQPPKCIISECTLLPLRVTNTTGGAPIVVDPTVIVAYSIRWWNYYAVWLRMPVVNLWMSIFEERYWDLWWKMGMGKGLRWTGLDDGREKNECVVQGWPRCDSKEVAVKGGLRFKYRGDL